MKNSTSLLTVIAGAATGAVLGLLYAPKKGSKIRKDITKKGNDYMQGAKDGITDFIHDLSDEINHVGKNTMHKIEDRSNHLIKNIKEKVS